MTEEYERFTHSRETLSKRPMGHSLANDSMETGYYRRRMGEPSEIIENEYYQVDLETPVHWGAEWTRYACFFRKDTGEVAWWLWESANDEESVNALLSQAVEAKLKELGRPKDWGRDP